MVDRNSVPVVTVVYAPGFDGTPQASDVPPLAAPPPLPALSPVRIIQQTGNDGGPTIIGPDYAPLAVKPPDRSLASLRPRDDSSSALVSAIDNIASEREATIQRVGVAQNNRRRALTDTRATAADVVAFEQRAREAKIEVERLDALAAELETKLESALRREAAARSAAEVARAKHAKAADDLGKALPSYQKAAEQVAHICELARKHDGALATLKQASAVAGISAQPAAKAPDACFLTHVVLPTPSGGTLWGTLPKQPLAHPYLNIQRGPYG